MVDLCDTCHFAKQHRLPFQQSEYVILRAFELIHIDMWGSIANTYIHCHKFFFTIIDDYTKHTWVYLMKTKGETRLFLSNFVLYVKTSSILILKLL